MLPESEIGDEALKKYEATNEVYLKLLNKVSSVAESTEKFSRNTESSASDQKEFAFENSSLFSKSGMHNADMTGISREEFEARLHGTAAEVRADFALLRADMADGRRESSEHLNQMRILTVEQLSAMRVDISSMSKELTREIGRVGEGLAEVRGSVAEVRGSVDGLKSSITMLQWVLALVATLAGIWLAYQQLKLSETTPASAPVAATAAPPVTIYVTGAPPAVGAVTPTSPVAPPPTQSSPK